MLLVDELEGRVSLADSREETSRLYSQPREIVEVIPNGKLVCVAMSMRGYSWNMDKGTSHQL